jgi:hypothetical protein
MLLPVREPSLHLSLPFVSPVNGLGLFIYRFIYLSFIKISILLNEFL